jgi:tetratricopeptide (TPR) repeat protein
MVTRTKPWLGSPLMASCMILIFGFVWDRKHSMRDPRGVCVSALLSLILLSTMMATILGCASTGRRDPNQLIYSPEDFQAELLARVPQLTSDLNVAPYVVEQNDVDLAEQRILEVPHGPGRVRALVAALSADPPTGFGLKYHWLASSTASRTLESRQGNCVALASVLVGLGRGLGWPIYYAEASTSKLDTHEYKEITFVSDHMVVVVAAKSFQIVVDFTGQIDDQYTLRPIDDITAYAHLINNIAGQHIARIEGTARDEDWQIALKGFELATQIQPDLGRAWNNRGIALTRLERFDEAKVAYEHALALDNSYGSARRNLEIMRTRAEGQTTVAEEPIPR